MSYTSQYPPAHSDTYVKSTTKYNTAFWAYYATDPANSLTGNWTPNSWISANAQPTNQRFHIDLGEAKIIKRIYLENLHYMGNSVDYVGGIKNFTFWGSNTGSGTFDDLVYANDDGWTQLTTDISYFVAHIQSDVSDPQYAVVTNSTAYRYYALKIADTVAAASYMGFRRVELQTEDGGGGAEVKPGAARLFGLGKI